MQLVGCTQHSEKNQLILTLPTFLADTKVSYEITITIPKAADYKQIEFD